MCCVRETEERGVCVCVCVCVWERGERRRQWCVHVCELIIEGGMQRLSEEREGERKAGRRDGRMGNFWGKVRKEVRGVKGDFSRTEEG